MDLKYYFPYKANDGKHKYYIITRNDKKIYFGAAGYYDYTIYYKKYGEQTANEKTKGLYKAPCKKRV